MSDTPSNFLTEIGETIMAVNPKNYRHREEMQATRFDQVIYFDEDEEGNPKDKALNKSKKNTSVLTDSEDSDDDSNSSCSDESDNSNDDSKSESSAISNSDSEEYDIWDNSDFVTHNIDLDNLKFCKNEEQTFFTLYKLRYCQIRNFLTKKLTQNQHQEININILKIVKSLSQNKIQQIQCHNYNYFQNLQDNKQYQRFADHFKQFNNSRKREQIKQKQTHLNNIKRSKSVIGVFSPQVFQGIKSAMNRASFSSTSKEGSPSDYYLTCRDKLNAFKTQYGSSTYRNTIDTTTVTQDTINSNTKRTIKDFDLEIEQKAKDSQNFNNYNLQQGTNSKITSLSHIPDGNEIQKQQQPAPQINLTSTPQKKFKIQNLQSCKNLFRYSTVNIHSTPLIPSAKESNSPLATHESTPSNKSAQNSTQSNISSNNQLKASGFTQMNNYTDSTSQEKRKSKFISEQYSPLDEQSPKNKTKAKIMPQSQTVIPQRETSVYFSNPSPQLSNINKIKPSTSVSQMRPLINQQYQSKQTQSQLQEDRFLPNLNKEKQTNQTETSIIYQGSQLRSTSSQSHFFYRKDFTNHSTLTNTPQSMLNKLQDSPPMSNFSQKVSFLEKNLKTQDNEPSAGGKTAQQKDCTTPVRISLNKGFYSPSLNSINKLRQSKMVFSTNQSYNVVIHKPIGSDMIGEQSQRSSQEYLLHSKMGQKQNDSQHQVAIIAGGQLTHQQQSQPNNSQAFQKLQFSNTFFKNQYINTSSTTNHGLIQSFKQISQN